MIFLYRLLKHLVIFIVTLPITIFGCIALGCVLPITKTYVPLWLRWFDCADPYVGRNTETIQRVVSEGWKSYWYFIGVRNPLNYFSYKYLGVDTTGCTVVSNDPEVGDNKAPGLQYTELLDKDHSVKAYEYYYIWVYIVPLTTIKKCIRLRLGYKLNGLGAGTIAQEVLVVSPFHSYTGV